ncbi:unnamed protein product [Lupinus luteus]|uniref:KANL2-like probable zinc-finger domain-containing protein n=1 Tax=Lupinus luteus TaxID=3873 RepID=A0AAV1YHD8_LUPLU
MDNSSPPPPPPPMTINGADEDSALSNSRVLTRRELIARRLRRVRQLARCYRGHYWTLMEDLKSKHREYYWIYGKSPFVSENANDTVVLGGNVNGATVVGNDVVRCATSGCKTKAMALTRFCHTHILSDSRQKLYRGCRFVVKNLPTGPSFCNKPVLRCTVPPACPAHCQRGEKCLLFAIKRAGYNLPNNRKPNPKLHLVVSEFVRQIQKKRKVAFQATIPKAETE